MAPAFTAAPTLSADGSAVGATLTVTPGTVTGSPAPSVTREIQRNNGGAWTVVSTGLSHVTAVADTYRVVETATNPSGNVQSTSASVVIDATVANAYSIYELSPTETHGGPVQIDAFNLRTSAGGTPLTGTYSASSQSGTLTGPEKAFDGTSGTFWQPAPGDTAPRLRITLASPQVVSHVGLQTPTIEASYTDSSLRAFDVLGSNDGSAFTVVLSKSELARATSGEYETGAGGGGPGATEPGAPTMGTATAGNGQATWTWTAPASDGGSAILDYRLTLSTGQVVTGITDITRTVSGLTNGIAVTATVAARNAVGYGIESAVSNSVTPVAPAAWAPSTLFTASEPGFALDFTDASTLSQDTAGATPVTAAGQTIGRVADISGRSNHATQATAASRPTWQTTYASLDGTDDFMVTAATNFTGTDKVTIIAAITPQAATSNVLVELSTGSNSNTGSFHVGAPNTTTSKFSYSRRGNGSRGYRESAAVAIPGAYVLAVSHDLSGTTHETETPTIRLNGAVPTLTNFESADTGGGTFGNYAMYIGSRNGASLRYNGHIHRMIVIGRALTADELADAEAWCAAANGVTLP